MNNVARSNQYADEVLRSYVCKDVIEKQLYQSVCDGSTIQPMKKNGNTMVKEMPPHAPHDDFDDSVSLRSSCTAMLEIETKSTGSVTSQRSGRHSAAVHFENPKAPQSKTLSIRSKAEASPILGNLESECYDNFNDSVKKPEPSTLNTASNSSPSSSYKPIGSNSIYDCECFLRTCQVDFKKELRQPVEPTKNFLNSMREKTSSENIFIRNKTCASTTVNLEYQRRSQLFSPKLFEKKPSSAITSRKNMLATLSADKESTEIVNNTRNGITHFGVPAGYAKNRLDTFGGINLK